MDPTFISILTARRVHFTARDVVSRKADYNLLLRQREDLYNNVRPHQAF